VGRAPTDVRTRPPPTQILSTVLVVDENEGKMYLSGGDRELNESVSFANLSLDLWEFSFEKKQWNLLSLADGNSLVMALRRTEHTAVLYTHKIFVFGGICMQQYSDSLYCYDLELQKLSQLNPTPIRDRADHTAVVWKNKMYIFAGWAVAERNEDRCWFNDLYEFDFVTLHWRQIVGKGEIPTPRCSHVAIASNDYMYTFGGYNGKDYTNELFSYHFETETWKNLTPLFANKVAPAPRSRTAMAVWNDSMFLLGGWNRKSYFSDFWRFEFGCMSWTLLSRPEKFPLPSLMLHRMCVHQDILYVVGGLDSKTNNFNTKIYKYHLTR